MLREDCHSRGTAWMLRPRGKEGGSTTLPSWLELGLLALMLSGLELDCARAEAADN
jgi:hypothetical protein